MKNSIFKSFRFEIVLYSLLSLIYTILTEAAICFGIYIMYNFLKKDEMAIPPSNILNNINSSLNNSATNFPNDSNALNYFGKNIVQSSNGSMGNKPGFFTLIIMALAMIGVVLFIIYFLLLTKKFVIYLDEISSGITEISNGNFKHRIDIKNEDEFAKIASKINKMADDIKIIIDNDRKSEDNKNQLITSVAHDLRTPLTSIIGYLELVSDQNKLTPDVRQKYIEVAYNKSKRLEKLIEDLFAYTNYSFGQTTLEITEIDMVKFMNQLIDEFYPSFTENKLEYEFITSVTSAVVLADGNLLARAFANLIANAIKYGSDGKRIEISLYNENGKVNVAITNYGRLIPEDELDNIFERFYRVEGSRSSETGGTGIGLAIVKSIIMMHEGTIHVKSDLNGTVFQVALDEKK